MIQEHHENWDGSGFPEQRQGGSIAESSQILHLANMFDRLCTGRIDGREMSPEKAFERILHIANNPSAVQEVDPALVKKIFSFLMKDATKIKKAQSDLQDRIVPSAENAFLP
jgi:HD-GYP domain-containing protein (c-di-GMP phosphodiesterase class II)